MLASVNSSGSWEPWRASSDLRAQDRSSRRYQPN